MWGRDQLRQFREAPWTTADELEAFVAGHVVPPGELLKLLGILLEAKLVAEGARHRNRCTAFSLLAGAAPDRSLCRRYLESLPAADPYLRRVLVELVPQVNDVESHGLLAQHLGADEAELRSAAAQLLAQVGGPSALAHLAELARKPRWAGRADAMEVMIPKARHRVLPLLAAVIEAGNPRERILALRHLADPQIGGKAAADAAAAIRPALTDADRRVVTEGFRAFASLVD